MSNLGRPELRLLSDLAVLERMSRQEGPTALRRLEAELGAERARFLVAALSREGLRREVDAVPPAASG